MSEFQQCLLWHRTARPNPTNENLAVQLGCHLEEVAEMLDAIISVAQEGPTPSAHTPVVLYLTALASDLKQGRRVIGKVMRKELLDALADQIVTTVGIAYCASMDLEEAFSRVNKSNFSKFVEGNPVFLPGGKIGKGPGYRPPDLEGLY